MLPFLLDSASDATKAIDACRSLDWPSLWGWVNGVPNYLFNFRFCEQQGARVWSITTSKWHHQYNSCLAAQVAEHIPPQHEEQFLENLGWNASLRMNQLSLVIQKSKTSNRLSWSLVRRNHGLAVQQGICPIFGTSDHEPWGCLIWTWDGITAVFCAKASTHQRGWSCSKLRHTGAVARFHACEIFPNVGWSGVLNLG